MASKNDENEHIPTNFIHIGKYNVVQSWQCTNLQPKTAPLHRKWTYTRLGPTPTDTNLKESYKLQQFYSSVFAHFV